MNVLGKVIEAINEVEGVALITADHGNCEQMIDYKTGEPFTSHTTNPVPLVLVGMDDVKLKDGKLADFSTNNARYNEFSKTRRNDRRKV